MVSRRLGAVDLGYLRVPEVSKHVVLVTIRPYQFNVLFHEYADSIVCQFDS